MTQEERVMYQAGVVPGPSSAPDPAWGGGHRSFLVGACAGRRLSDGQPVCVCVCVCVLLLFMCDEVYEEG